MTHESMKALPPTYEEIFIWWNSSSGLQRRIARLQHDKRYFQLATFSSDTSSQYLAKVEDVERWASIKEGE